MEKFTKIKTKNNKKTLEDDQIFKNEDITLLSFENNSIIKSKDQVVILPYLREEGFILLKYDHIPAFKFHYKDRSDYSNVNYYLTCMKGEFKENESETQNVRRIIHEECGMVLSNIYSIEVDKILFKNDKDTGQYHICLLTLSYNDYKQTTLKLSEGDTRVVKVSLGDIDDIKTYDLITDYMILKLKYDLK